MMCDDLLNRARELLRSAEADWRASLLETGRLLHEFVLAYLREGDEMPAAVKRTSQGRTRPKAMALASESLGVSTARINFLISTAMAVELLADNGHVGGLGWNTLRLFGRFVRRRKVDGGKHSVRRAVQEEWVIKNGFAETAPDLFRRAVRECWTQRQAQPLVQIGDVHCNGEKTRRQIRRTKDREELIAALRGMVKASAPRDAAEMLFDVVSGAENPVAVANLLAVMVKDAPRRKRIEMSEAS